MAERPGGVAEPVSFLTEPALLPGQHRFSGVQLERSASADRPSGAISVGGWTRRMRGRPVHALRFWFLTGLRLAGLAMLVGRAATTVAISQDKRYMTGSTRNWC